MSDFSQCVLQSQAFISASFISLGPTCVPAELLKAGSLRSCTFGFDWMRSGFHHLSELFTLSVDDYLLKHVWQPNIPLIQTISPETVHNRTSEPSPVRPLFGYPYLYTPHRSYGVASTHHYLERSFRRLHAVLRDPSAFKIFVLCDYVNKDFASYFSDSDTILSALINLLDNALLPNSYYIAILRLRPSFSSSIGIHFNPIVTKPEGQVSVVQFPGLLDDECLRSHTYRILAKKYLAPFSRGLPLWMP